MKWDQDRGVLLGVGTNAQAVKARRYLDSGKIRLHSQEIAWSHVTTLYDVDPLPGCRRINVVSVTSTWHDGGKRRDELRCDCQQFKHGGPGRPAGSCSHTLAVREHLRTNPPTEN